MHSRSFLGVNLGIRLAGRQLVFIAILNSVAYYAAAQPFDIAPFARACRGGDKYGAPTTFDYSFEHLEAPQFERIQGRYVCGLQWSEERDVEEVRLYFNGAVTNGSLRLEYWFQNWPYPAPTMPTIEDPVDDPWQGRWLKADSMTEFQETALRFTFQPLNSQENPKASNLPGLRYRRTLKLRVVSEDPPPPLAKLEVYSGSTRTNVTLRVALGTNSVFPLVCEGRLTAYNGTIRNLRGWGFGSEDSVHGSEFRLRASPAPFRKGVVFDVEGSAPTLGGSHDVTLINFRASERTFTVALPDVQRGPMYLPDFDALVSLASAPEVSLDTLIQPGQRIRERLAHEPEQTYERATNEIPVLDPVERQGGRLYLPLTLDSSWQKFALAWGGNVFLNKRSLKAKGAELKRLEWAGERLEWRFGTGDPPSFRPAAQDSKLSVLEDFLPIAIARWTTGEIEYRQEAFATALSGPLGLEGRDEQSPVVLVVKLTARNTSVQPRKSHLWLGLNPSEQLKFGANELVSIDGELVRAHLVSSPSAKASLATFADNGKQIQGLHIESLLDPAGEDSQVVLLPFLPRLTVAQRKLLGELKYDEERARIITYWRAIADAGMRFEIPEKRFLAFSRSMLVHMHLSTAKDPKSGLFMVPAASYDYQVYANESCFQVLALDALGDHKTAEEYLETFVRLQGSKPFPGTYTGDQREVYHGAKVDDQYDYTAADYNLDHGTVLWTMAEHYFMTRDRAWLEHAVPGMIRAADWVTFQRRQTALLEDGKPVPEYGLLPAGHLEDNSDWGHWFAVNAYASAGMMRLGEALREIGHPEAERINRDAEAFRLDLRSAVVRARQEAPVTRLRDNTYIPYVPVRPHQRFRLFGPLRVDYYRRYPNPVLPTYRLSATREVLYGPLILLNLGVFQGQEPIAGWLLDDWEDNLTMSSSFGLNVHGWVDDDLWFSRGGMVFQANLQNPVLAYLRRGEIPAALRNLYNDFVACLYPDVNTFTEEYRAWRSPSGPFYKIPDEARFVSRVRDLLVHEEGTTLWLTPGTPRRWLLPENRIRLNQMPTTFGPVDLSLTTQAMGIECEISLPTRNPPAAAELVLRMPEDRTLAGVEINGKPWIKLDPARNQIHLPMDQVGPLRVTAKWTTR